MITLVPHGRKHNYIAVENSWFVSLLQRLVAIKVLNKPIQKLLVSRKFLGCPFANQFFYLLVVKRPILFWNIYAEEPYGFFQCALD